MWDYQSIKVFLRKVIFLIVQNNLLLLKEIKDSVLRTYIIKFSLERFMKKTLLKTVNRV